MMEDNRILLDGMWAFQHLIEDCRGGSAGWRQIAVPGPWQAQFTDLRMRGGTGIYRRDFVVPAGWMRDRIFVKFSAVFHVTRVWINGTYLGMQIGGFLPFSFDATDAIVEGRNEIEVRVDSPVDDPNQFPETPFGEVPFGKQSWYGPLSGIWQSVWMERRVADHLTQIRIRADWETGKVAIRAFFAQPALAETSARVSVHGPEESTAVTVVSLIPAGSDRQELDLTVMNVKPWSPEAPNLYKVLVTLERNSEVVDEVEDRFGFRKIETRDGRFYLNGEPLYIRGALDQDYYPDTICSTPSTSFLEDQFRKAKELGLNCLRCHIKAPDPRYYEVADRMGLLIWTELPNLGLLTEQSRARQLATLKGIIDRDGNHPSIICWTIINENWGFDLVHDSDHRDWLRRTFQWLKSYDPGRLVVDNSPIEPSFHVQTDIADYHFYAAFPDNRSAWDAFADELASRAEWLYAPDDTPSSHNEPLMCSEFGNWGLPHPEALKDAAGHEPWWFETGHDWSEGVMYPHGVENRFADWSLSRVFGTLNAFVEATQWQQFRALKYEIERLRERETIAGYVITELTDAHWESNGLLDMRRNPRVFHDVFRSINADTVIVPRWTRLSYWAGERVALDLHVAHGASGALKGTVLEVALDRTERIRVPEITASSVVSLGSVSIAVPEEPAPCLRRLSFVLKGADGSVIASNFLDLAIHPRCETPPDIGPLWSPDQAWRSYLTALGYSVLPRARADALWITAGHDDAIAAHVRDGGRLLMLPEVKTDLSPLFPHWQRVRVRERAETPWQGDWASTFSWLHRPLAFSRLPGGPLLDETFDRVLPTHVIAGCNLLDFQARVHAGLVIGWIHRPVALCVERRYGRGRFVASTFRLFRDPPGTDPTAAILLDSLLELALAQGSAAARDRDSVIGGVLERAG